MDRSKPSVYRDALQISLERIAAMSPQQLNSLMGRLLRAQAHRSGSSLSGIRINAEDTAKDDGCDGWSPKPPAPDDWLGWVDTCWQFKAGKAGEPARLVGEVSKPIARDTLINGGRFVVVASGSRSGKKGEKDRRARLVDDAQKAKIPFDRIEVMGSERLANWCNQHPAVAAYWAGRPDGLWTFDDWSGSNEHQAAWQASEAVESELAARRADLDHSAGDVFHLHIQGPPGVGKTRFALELCRKAPWVNSAVYVRQAEDVRLLELIDSAATEEDVRLTVVADEVQRDQLRPLRDSVGRGEGRIRLVTIGHTPSPDPSSIPAVPVKPLDRETMVRVIRGWHPAMPPEHVEFIVCFADGYVGLARLAATAVARDPAIDVRTLLGRDEIRMFLDRMLGPGDRCGLYVVAVLTSVGWTGDKQDEGETIARHLGFDWNRVRATVDGFHRRMGVSPRGGRYRYISPGPLGTYLAAEAWDTYPDRLRSLADVLPSEGARDAYYDRLRSIASNTHPQEHAREQLAQFSRASDFVDVQAVRQWSAFSSVDPDQAARRILGALSGASLEDRSRIRGRARREAVSTLVGLAWRSSSFHDAVKALALLAEAENETWANNASAEFVARFQLTLGGTSIPYLDRLPVIDELLAEGRPSLTSLAVKALAQVGNAGNTRDVVSPASGEVPEREWQPLTRKESSECIDGSIARLRRIAELGVADMESDLVAAAKNLSLLLCEPIVSNLIMSLFCVVREKYPATRELLRKIIADIIYREKTRWNRLSGEDLAKLEELHACFEGHSLRERLQQQVGYASWGRQEVPSLTPLAEELLADPEVLAEHFPWLTSGSALDAWRLGEALAAADSGKELARRLFALPGGGPDQRLLCGYVGAVRRATGDEWYDNWMASLLDRDPKPVALFFEVAWRCGATERVASMIAGMLRSDSVSPEIVDQSAYGGWSEHLASDALETVLKAMMDTGHSKAAVGILQQRIRRNPREAGYWKPLALKLAISPELIRSADVTNYCWGEVANTVIADYPREIAAAIFREQADTDSDTWFAEYSEAASVLIACAQRDPKGVWEAMHPHMSEIGGGCMFSIGFPRDLLERLPGDDVVAWVAQKPEERASILSRLIAGDVSTDDRLASRIIGEYGDNREVANAFFAEYVCGVRYGPASSNWDKLAQSLESVARQTALPKLRRWATDSARSLREMAERDRRREEERYLRRC